MYELYRILKFPGTLTIVTAVVSLVAVYIYEKQKYDRRKEVAGIILAEIKRAEDRIPDVKKVMAGMKKSVATANADKIQVLPTNSWQVSQHILARSLPDDVMKIISDFYANCTLLDELLTYNYEAYHDNITQVRINKYRINADYLKERIDCEKPNPRNVVSITSSNQNAVNDIENKRKSFEALYPTLTSYYASKPVEDAENALNQLPDNLSQNRVGGKLRRIQLGFFGGILKRKQK